MKCYNSTPSILLSTPPNTN